LARIAIIGSGVSGLAAAIELLRLLPNGFAEITLFEARHVAGGRTRSYIDEESGDTIDNGQHLLMGCYTATLSYLESIGTIDLVQFSRGLRIPFSIYNKFTGTTRIATLKTSSLPAPFHALLGIIRTDLLNMQERWQALRLGRLCTAYLNDERIMSWSCAELFAKLGQSQTVIHKLWEPICLATINAKVEDASAFIFLNVIKIALLESAGNSRLLIPKVGLSELLIDSALKKLISGDVAVQLKANISSITQHGIGLAITTNGESAALSFDAVILACAPGGINLPHDLQLPTIDYSPIVNGYFWLDRKVLNSPMQGCLNTSLQWVFAKHTKNDGQLLALTVSAADQLIDLTVEEIVQLLCEDLQRSIPEARVAKLLQANIIKEKRATPRFTAEFNQKRPETTTPISGFYLAGDLVQNELPATIEGAIRNGFAAAEQVATFLLGK
jgi:squalene-associated FAD-dependent desaturase